MSKTNQVEQPVLSQTEQTDLNNEQQNESEENLFETQYSELFSELTKTQEHLSLLKNNLKRFYKSTERQLTKLSRNKRNTNKNRSPTGFGKVKPVPLTLKTLLNLEDNVEMTRPAVTKKLYEYIDANNLRSAEDKRIIKVNDNLTKAFKLTKEQVKNINASKTVKDDNGLNFYNIQKYVAKLYQETDTKTVDTEKVVVKAVVEKEAKEAKTEKKSVKATK